MPKDYFPRVKEAREALRAKAEEIIDLYMQNAKDAHGSGDFETCSKSLQWLLEHMPASDLGEKVVEVSIDKPAHVEGPNQGTTIQIGFALGGINTPKELPPTPLPVIDIDPPDHE